MRLRLFLIVLVLFIDSVISANLKGGNVFDFHINGVLFHTETPSISVGGVIEMLRMIKAAFST